MLGFHRTPASPRDALPPVGLDETPELDDERRSRVTPPLLAERQRAAAAVAPLERPRSSTSPSAVRTAVGGDACRPLNRPTLASTGSSATARDEASSSSQPRCRIGPISGATSAGRTLPLSAGNAEVRVGMVVAFPPGEQQRPNAVGRCCSRIAKRKQTLQRTRVSADRSSRNPLQRTRAPLRGRGAGEHRRSCQSPSRTCSTLT
jgi:hypothetical protein